MVIKSSLRRITHKISEAVKKAASEAGLIPGDYALVGSFDAQTDRIDLTLGTDRSIDR